MDKNKKKKLIIISSISAVVLIIAIIVIMIFVGNGDKDKKEIDDTTTEVKETTESLEEKEAETSTEPTTTEAPTETTTEISTEPETTTPEGNNTENETMANGEKYYYVKLGLKLGWNDSGEMGFEAGDYIYVHSNGDIYYFSSETDKNSFDTNNPNKAFLFYSESTGLIDSSSGGSVSTGTEISTQTPEPTTKPTDYHTDSSNTDEDEDWWQGFDPTKLNRGDGIGYDPNNQ